MSISDEELAILRGRPAYRIALWLGRLAVVPGFAPFAIVPLADGISLADALFVCFWPYLAMLAGAGLLLWQAGVPFQRDGWSVGSAADPKLSQAITADFFFRRR